MAFDAGAVESRLTVDTSQFDRDLNAAEARVKRFEGGKHEVKLSAVFDSSSLSRARQQFAQLDQQVSKDAMSRLRSSPQGSVLGALNALFSPHSVTGAPSASQAAQQGLLGKVISQPGGGTSGGGPQDTTTTDRVKTVGLPTNNAIQTTDRVNVTGLPTSGGTITTQDRVNVTGLPTSGGTITTKVKADTADANAELDKTALKADALGRKTETIKVKADTSGVSKTLAKLSDQLQSKSGPAWLGPALLALPAAGALTGVAAGAAAGLGGAFVAGTAALAAFGAVAKPVLSDALKAEQAAQKAQDAYTVAIATGTTKAVAYKAEQGAIAKAYAGLSPAQIALSKQLGNMADAWQKVKAAETSVVAGALQPWLKSVSDLTGKLSPIISAVAPVIGDLGTRVDGLVRSPEFTKFLDFVTGTGTAAVGAAGGTVIDFIDAFITLLPKFTPLINGAVNGIAGLGPAVLAWANSKKTADDITGFMAWFTANGPVVGGLLKNIGGALMALAPGLTAGGVTELKLISDFFGWVARLPPSVAKPLAEVAGALLLLSKLGVLKVGVQFIGKVASWLAGGVISVGTGATAAAEIEAAMASGGAQAAAEIRAAMATGGATAGAEVGGAEAAGGARAATAFGAAGLGTTLGLAAGAAIGTYLAEKQFSNLFNQGVAAANPISPSGAPKQGAPLPAVLAGTGTNTTLKINVDAGPLDALLAKLGFTQSSIGAINKLTAKPGSDVGALDALLYSLGANQSDILAINKLVVSPKSSTDAVDALLAKINLTPGEIDLVNKQILKPGSSLADVDKLLREIGLTPPQIAAVNKLVVFPQSDTSKVDALLTRIGLTPPQIADVNRLVVKPGDDTSAVDALLAKIGLTPPQIAAVNKLVVKPTSDSKPVTDLQSVIDSLHGKTVNVGVFGSGSGKITFAEQNIKNAQTGYLEFHAAGGLIKGGTPGKDSVLGMLMPGEVVVPQPMVAGGEVDHLRGRLPGFAGGGLVGPYGVLSGVGQDFMGSAMTQAAQAVETAAAQAMIADMQAKVAAAASAAAASFIGSGGATGGIIQAMMQSMAAARGWTGAEWVALANVEQREAGFNMTATNPSSGAYGLAQFINGPSEYAQYGGNSTTAQGQITGMLNYISCMPLDAAILTRTGWKSHAEVQVGDETVGFDPETGEARWTVVTAVHHYDAAPVRRMRNTTADLRSTPNHRWITEKLIQTGTSKPNYYRQEMVRTDEIGTRHRIRLAARLTQEEALSLTSVEAELLGWIAGDGSVYRRDMHGKGGRSAEVRVAQSEAKPEHLRRLRALLSRLPHSEYAQGPNHWSAKSIHSFRLSAPYAHDLLMRSGYESSLELMVLNMSAPQREAFLFGLLMADGHRRPGDDGWMLAQNEGPVLDAAVLAATLLGNFCNLTDSAGQKHVVVTRGPFVKGNLDARHQEEYGEEPVWCVTTELGTWTARQDSQVFLTGNSRYGDPIAAEAHEVAYGWYDRGGPLKPGYTLAYNGTGRPEQVIANGGAGASFDDVVARLDKLIRATEQVPAGVGAHVGGAINGAAHDASFRSRYPRGSG